MLSITVTKTSSAFNNRRFMLPQRLNMRMIGSRSGRGLFFVGVTCFSSSWAFRSSFIRRRKDSHLCHQPKRVHDNPGFLDPPFHQAIYHNAPHRYSAPGSGDTEKLCAVRSAPNKSAHYFVAFLNLLFERPVHVGKRSAEAAQDVF